MNLFSRTPGREQLTLVFDVGSSSVGGALFSAGEGGNPHIVASARELLVLEENIDADRFLDLTLKSLEKVAAVLASKGAPRRVFVILSSPWYSSQTRIIKMKKDEPFVFTNELADELIKKEREIFKKE